MSITINGTSGITSPDFEGPTVGVTDGSSASAGHVGELLSSTASGTPISLTNVVAANMCSVTLTPGVWDVSARASFSVTGNCNQRYVSASPTSLTINTACYVANSSTQTAGFQDVLNTNTARVVVTSNTTYYCVVRASFSSGAAQIDSAEISARRVR